MCNMTSSTNSFKSTCPTGRVLWEELLVLSRLQADKRNFCPLCNVASRHIPELHNNNAELNGVQEKEPIICMRERERKISTSLMMPNSDPWDNFFNPSLSLMIDY